MISVDGQPKRAEFQLVKAKRYPLGGKSDAGTHCDIQQHDNRGYLEHEISTLVGDDKAHYHRRMDSSSDEEIDAPSFMPGPIPHRRIILPASYTKNPEHRLMNRQYLLIQS